MVKEISVFGTADYMLDGNKKKKLLEIFPPVRGLMTLSKLA